MTRPIFHLAFPVTDLDATRQFFADVLGCTFGRASDRWLDINFYGHQISAHLVDTVDGIATNDVDSKRIPVRHFGLILEWTQWHELRDRLLAQGASFLVEPYLRFEGQPSEQATLFITDPSGNALEFKSFKDQEDIFRV